MSNQHKIPGHGKSEFRDQNEPLYNLSIPYSVSDKHTLTNKVDIDDYHIQSTNKLKETFTWEASKTKTRNPNIQDE